MDGLRDSIKQFSGDVHGTTPKDVIDLLLLTQYFDMLKEVSTIDIFVFSSVCGNESPDCPLSLHISYRLAAMSTLQLFSFPTKVLEALPCETVYFRQMQETA